MFYGWPGMRAAAFINITFCVRNSGGGKRFTTRHSKTSPGGLGLRQLAAPKYIELSKHELQPIV